MVRLTEKQLADAERRGEEGLRHDPRAVSARYERASGRVVVELINGCAYVFPAGLVQDLQNASPEHLDEVEVDGLGYNLHWPALDVDVFVPSVVAGIFGTRAWMAREFARAGGQARSVAKSAAARANGLKGGRPRKVAS